jgi:hypothetical protein
MNSDKKYCKKVSFGTEADANFYIEKLRKTSTRPIIPVRAYLCEKCNNWHLTHIQQEDIPKILAEHERVLRALKRQIKERDAAINRLNSVIAKQTASIKHKYEQQ